MKHFRCKICADISIWRHYHIHSKHKEIDHSSTEEAWSKIPSYFDQVQRIIGKDWITKTDLMIQTVKDWKAENPNLPIYSNIKIEKRSWFRTILILANGTAMNIVGLFFFPYPFTILNSLMCGAWVYIGLKKFSKKSIAVPNISDKQQN